MSHTQGKAYFVSATTTVVKSTPGRVYGFYVLPAGAAGLIEVKNGSVAATVEGQWAITSIGAIDPVTVDLYCGVRCDRAVYVSQPSGSQTTFYID